MRRAPAREEGSVSVIAAALAGVLAMLIGTLAAVASIRAERTRIQAVADIAVLSAGPDLRSGCALAGQIAARNSAKLTSCERLGLDLRVRLAAPILLLGSVSAAARASPVIDGAPPAH